MGRKLSAVVALNDDYEGGVFETLDSDTPRSYDLKKGEMIMFPSFLMHRVTPVTKGIRRSLVIWVEGPNFR
jgi:PKHD-type hydroxylase